MSDQMYNEVPVIGKKYNFGDWKLYAKANDQEIKGFFGEYRWLSNFHPCPVYFEGLQYPSSENAFQAAKVIEAERQWFILISASESKRAWKLYSKMYKEEEWKLIKYDIMSAILVDKFGRNYDLRDKLLNTGNKYLEETNHWHDNDWGVCVCEQCSNKPHLNNLGNILMKVREFWC